MARGSKSVKRNDEDRVSKASPSTVPQIWPWSSQILGKKLPLEEKIKDRKLTHILVYRYTQWYFTKFYNGEWIV